MRSIKIDDVAYEFRIPISTTGCTIVTFPTFFAVLKIRFTKLLEKSPITLSLGRTYKLYLFDEGPFLSNVRSFTEVFGITCTNLFPFSNIATFRLFSSMPFLHVRLRTGASR